MGHLSAGVRIGSYSVIEQVGSGGMGDVYRAHDARLNRYVALKVLPDAFVDDPRRLARFEREAQVLASLNHPNIAQVYGLEEAAGLRAIVMELVEGPTLADMLARSGRSSGGITPPSRRSAPTEARSGSAPAQDVADSGSRPGVSRPGRGLPIDEAVAIARQMAEALEAAHELGIIHRDLKPANVKVRPDGTVKVLDFGLASAPQDWGEGLESPESPTFTSPAMTQPGVILGTAAYMPPEQARGKRVDRRADVWAFGVVLFEMLSGERLFAGETVTDVLAAVVSRGPDWDALPADTPPWLRRLLERCLVHDPKGRLRDIGEARIAIDEARARPGGLAETREPVVAAPRVRALVWGLAVAGVAALAFVGGWWWQRPAPETRAVVRAQIVLASDGALAFGMRPTLAVAPDGSYVVVALQQDGRTQLYQRSLAEASEVPIEGTDDGTGPFFSPDGRMIGFFAEGKLKKISAEGGTPVVVADAPLGQGGSFTPDGTIVFSPVHGEGLWKVSPGGGPAEALTIVRHEQGEAGHHWPHVLPDGGHALMTVELKGKSYSEARIVLVSLATREQRVLVEGGADGRYVPTGHLVYWSRGDLWAVPFDLTRHEVTGSRVPVLREVMAGEPNGFADYAFARNGTLVFLQGVHPQETRRLVVVNRAGISQPLIEERRGFETPRVSPDGKLLAVSVTAANDNLWIYEFARGTLTRLTFDDENRRAAWSADGHRLAFTSHAGGRSYAIQVAPVDGSSAPQTVHQSDRPELPESWSATGALVFTRRDSSTGSDVWMLPLSAGGQPQAVLESRFEEGEARVSFDGRWLAYQSNESGQFEVYVRPFPGPGGKRQVSVDGGAQPRWRRDGRELYYLRRGTVMVVDVSDGKDFSSSLPRALFSTSLSDESLDVTSWDAMPDGDSFVIVEDQVEPRRSLELTLGWFEGLRRLGSADTRSN